MASEWFYGDAGEKRGPFGLDELKRLAETGVIKPSTLVWKTGLKEWVRAKQVRGLFGAIPSEPIPTTPPALPGEPPPLPAPDFPPVDPELKLQVEPTVRSVGTHSPTVGVSSKPRKPIPLWIWVTVALAGSIVLFMLGLGVMYFSGSRTGGNVTIVTPRSNSGNIDLSKPPDGNTTRVTPRPNSGSIDLSKPPSLGIPYTKVMKGLENILKMGKSSTGFSGFTKEASLVLDVDGDAISQIHFAALNTTPEGAERNADLSKRILKNVVGDDVDFSAQMNSVTSQNPVVTRKYGRISVKFTFDFKTGDFYILILSADAVGW